MIIIVFVILIIIIIILIVFVVIIITIITIMDFNNNNNNNLREKIQCEQTIYRDTCASTYSECSEKAYPFSSLPNLYLWLVSDRRP
jgi:uncharacterized protein YpmB